MDNRQILSQIIIQFFGFGVVFLILKHFAWGKILGAIDARRKKIEDSFSEIEKQKKNLDDLEKDYQKKLDTIEQEARAKIQEASQAGQELARDIQERARGESQKIIDHAKDEIEKDIAQARLQIRDEVVELSGLMTEKIIRQKLNDTDHKKLVEQFIKEMERVS